MIREDVLPIYGFYVEIMPNSSEYRHKRGLKLAEFEGFKLISWGISTTFGTRIAEFAKICNVSA